MTEQKIDAKPQSEMRERNRLGTDPIRPLIKELALPAIVAQVINLLYNIVDRIYIGRIPEVGPLALSGLGIATPIILIVSAFAAFSAYGGAPLASLALGAEEHDRARRLLQSNASLNLGLAALITLLSQLFLPQLLQIFGAQTSNRPYAQAYLRIYLMGTVFVLMVMSLNSFISAQGEAKIAMRTVVIGAVANIILDPIFIFLFKLGVRGAAYATILSQAISMLAVLKFLSSSQARLRLRRLSFEARLVWQSVRLGVSGFIMIATESAVIMVYNRLLGAYGGELHVANMVILQSVMQMLFIPMNGYVAGVQPLLGYNYGARQYERVREILKNSLVLLFAFSFSTAVLAALLPGLFASIFTGDTALKALVIRYLPIFIIGMSIFGLQEIAQMYFVGTNQALKSIFLAMLRKVILLIPLCFLLAKRYGLMGIYVSEALADFCSASTAGFMFFHAYRSLKDKLKADPTPLK